MKVFILDSHQIIRMSSVFHRVDNWFLQWWKFKDMVSFFSLHCLWHVSLDLPSLWLDSISGRPHSFSITSTKENGLVCGN